MIKLNELKELKKLIKDKIYGISKDEDGYIIKLWNINKSSYNVGVREKKNIDIVDRILKEGRELNVDVLDFFNFMIFEF